MKQKGQAALEFIFIMVIVIVYIFTVTRPMIENTSGYLSDIEKVTRVSSETQKLMNSIERVSMMGTGSKEKVTLFIPDGAHINCPLDGTIGFGAKLSSTPYPPQCSSGNCDRNFPKITGITVDCRISGALTYIRSVSIEKSNDNTVAVKG